MTDDPSEQTEGCLDATKSMSDAGPGTAPSEPRQLRTSDVLSGRFTIVRFLARGGMGEVYEAADSHLQNKHCALKILRKEIAADPVVRQRFEREVLLAREVAHPNVCPTFDLFREDGPDGPILFLTMRLLRGESLSARLHRAGAVSPEAALPIVRQMAQALGAAHRAGVIHRDFKPGNVMLEGTGPETRVSITDFGLSRAYKADHTLAETGRISGTIGYIAPELLQGATATPAADIYAFGVVVHEMLTGRRPEFKPGTRRFQPPSHFVAALPRVWDRLVTGCLEGDASKRFQSADEALGILEPQSFSTRSVQFRAPMSRRRRAALAAAGALTLGAAWWLAVPALNSLVNPLPKKRFVALMEWPPQPNSPYGKLLKNVLSTTGNRLARAESSTKDLLVISPGDVTGQTPPKGPVDAVGALGANLVLAASAAPARGGVTLSLQLLDAATQKVFRHDELTVAASRLGQLPDLAASASARLLEVREVRNSAKEVDEIGSLPAPAYLTFTTAEELMGRPNRAGLDDAIEAYQKTLDLAPQFAQGYAKLAIAYVQKFLKTQDRAFLGLARRNADLALKYKPGSAQVLLAEALVDVNLGLTQQAIDELGRALQQDPKDPAILVAKARALRDLGRRAEEADVYRSILADRPNYWPAYNELGWVLYRQGDYQKAADTFAEGSAVAPKVAMLFVNVGTMNLLLDRKKEAEAAFESSLERLPNELAYQNLGSIAFSAGNYRKALDYYTKARDLRPSSDSSWRNIADCYAMLGDARQEKESYAKAAELVANNLRINPKPGALWMNQAFYQAKLGQRTEAEASLTEAEAHGATDMHSKFKKAQVLAVLGKKEEALRQVLECLSKGLSKTEVELALDLKEVRNDPRYKRLVAQIRSEN
ncbi:MAG TPA: serine/threonine-protein kinase [Candidatus Sulfopaludibacter sp.]|jgi:serine/threonine protein kinase/Tfp pilus assembly protein PilF|nr:serine/threonine-protein kinase [Candidatus Sulfopaludibacter sp.]